MLKRIQEIHKSIQDLNTELEEIRHRCTHDKHSETPFMCSPAYPCTGMVCDDCGEYLGEYKSYNEWTKLKFHKNNLKSQLKIIYETNKK